MLYTYATSTGATGIVGEVEDGDNGENEYYLWTHKKLDIGYNGDKVS